MAPSDRARIRRRRLLMGAAGLACASACETLSLRGSFDHRTALPSSARERFEASARRALREDGIVHLAHSTHLVTLAGQGFLTDPWFHDPAFGALRHAVTPPVQAGELGALSAILISHEHADHADFRALDRMDKRATVFCATNDLKARARQCGFSEVHVLLPWESTGHRGVLVHAVPAVHDCYEVGFVLQVDGKSVYFAGDTRLHDDLEAIRERFAPTFAILPVDGTRVRGSSLSVMTPEDACVAARRLGVRGVMPSHAEAEFSDPLVKHALATTVPRAAHAFQERMTAELPRVATVHLAPGEFVRL